MLRPLASLTVTGYVFIVPSPSSLPLLDTPLTTNVQGQLGSESIRTHCDSGVDSITLGFVNNAPDSSGLPGTNFGPNCWADTYPDSNGDPSKLLSHCMSLQADIPYCKSKGVKVLLSIGGVYNSTTSNYYVGNNTAATSFATFLYNAFGTFNPLWTGPRPFDSSPTDHTSVDGFDFDIEANFGKILPLYFSNRARVGVEC